jgi:hypothetical protein
MIAIDSAIESVEEGAPCDCDFSGEGIAIPSTLPDEVSFQVQTQMDYAVQHMVDGSEANSKPKRRRSPWVLLLVLPYLGLCFPRLYAHATPERWGFPYFYWYQFAWVIATSALLAIVYRKLKT